jgi:hypothetical protein
VLIYTFKFISCITNRQLSSWMVGDLCYLMNQGIVAAGVLAIDSETTFESSY